MLKQISTNTFELRMTAVIEILCGAPCLCRCQRSYLLWISVATRTTSRLPVVSRKGNKAIYSSKIIQMLNLSRYENQVKADENNAEEVATRTLHWQN